jgi:hypothetical protein
MVGTIHYRILSPDGSLSDDTFVTAPDQPETIKDDCLLVIDEMTEQRLTVHGTRLFPAECPTPSPINPESRSRCLDCGRVSGVVEDAVVCPLHQDEAACVFVQSHAT